MRHRFIILSAFCAVLCFAPAWADDPNATATTTSQATEEPAQESAEETEQIVETDEEMDEIQNTVDSMGWCTDDDDPQDESGDYDDEDEDDDAVETRQQEICAKLRELKSLEQELKTAAVQEAQDKYADAKENEQSLANRTLSSLTMAATGIGGMELARGLAEQNADKAAQDEMNAYISGFQCKIGGKSYSGGTNGIEAPGVNQLIKLYQEYVDLAASLKERKAALGLKPGIESDVVLDKAATGMYDDVGHGIENGTYASLYRAVKGNATDAQKLQEQQDASKKRVIGGAIAAGAGVVGGIIGNIAINGNRNKNQNVSSKQNEIKERYNQVVQELVNECNTTIQAHKDFAAKLTSEQLQDKDLAEYKKDVDAAKTVNNLTDIKESLFCK